jgi:hypothetical protein
MLHLVRLLIGNIAMHFKPLSRLEAKVIVLGHQLGILRRQASKRVGLSGLDRLSLVPIEWLFPSVAAAVTIIRPDTIIRGHPDVPERRLPPI